MTFGLKTLRVWRWENETLWPYILPLPEISQIAILFLLHRINDLFESLRVVHGEISEDFAIQSDVLFPETGDELGVGKAVDAGGVVNAGNPEGAEVAFFVATIAVRITESLDDTLFTEAVRTSAGMLHAFGFFQHFLVFGVCCNAAFDSHDLSS